MMQSGSPTKIQLRRLPYYPREKSVVLYDGKGKLEVLDPDQPAICSGDAVRTEDKVVLAACEKAQEVYAALSCVGGKIYIYCCKEADIKCVAEGDVKYGITHLTFCGSQVLAAADPEGEIHLIDVNYSEGTLKVKKGDSLKLGIFCRNVKTEGLVPEDIRLRLERHVKRETEIATNLPE